ncbi:MAG TPA: hypothetical protein VH743_14010 [Beijerinckiaceae bacterium]|jgi:hypothetical protein
MDSLSNFADSVAAAAPVLLIGAVLITGIVWLATASVRRRRRRGSVE